MELAVIRNFYHEGLIEEKVKGKHYSSSIKNYTRILRAKNITIRKDDREKSFKLLVWAQVYSTAKISKSRDLYIIVVKSIFAEKKSKKK